MTSHDQVHPDHGVAPPVDRATIDGRYGSVSQIFAALASPLRCAIVHRLTVREHSVAELVADLGASQPLVSQHLARLRHNGLVAGRRQGRQVLYRVADEHVAHVFLDAYQHSVEIEE